MAFGASVSSPMFLGGGGEDASGSTIACPRAEADAPKARALGKHVVSPVGSTAEVEQVAVGAMRPPPHRVEGAPQKRQVEASALAPHKALKVSTSSTTQWVVEAQATIQRGAVSVRADLKEPVAQGEATETATEQAEEEEEPTPHEAKAHESDGVEAPSIAEATEAEAEALRTSEAEVVEAEALRTSEAKAMEARVSRTTKAEVAEAGVGAIEPAAQEAKTEAGQASVPPPVQDPPLVGERPGSGGPFDLLRQYFPGE
ncbi:uncharacterized protein [Miscanthus floridulus]|uniref:uncharacterized protein n=1 Tax=Miscanthus floridulus TaxID=154761 RepID=UPI0034581BAA